MEGWAPRVGCSCAGGGAAVVKGIGGRPRAAANGSAAGLLMPAVAAVVPFGTTWSLTILKIAGKEAWRKPCATFLRSVGKAGPSSRVTRSLMAFGEANGPRNPA